MEKDVRLDVMFWGAMIMAHLASGLWAVGFACWALLAAMFLIAPSIAQFWRRYVSGFWARVRDR